MVEIKLTPLQTESGYLETYWKINVEDAGFLPYAVNRTKRRLGEVTSKDYNERFGHDLDFTYDEVYADAYMPNPSVVILEGEHQRTGVEMNLQQLAEEVLEE